ncbi:MAG: cytochrome c biogenesis protein CcsA [Acidobacteria bacterium]|nr:cytochrome c biogenesis protein CcsA [Acidobacteriota bacterium]
MTDRRFDRLAFLLGTASLVLLLSGFYYCFLVAPVEATMAKVEPVQRIFYIHLPSAFIAFLAFFIVFVASLAYLITRELHFDWLAVSAAEVGVVFCIAVLVTGPLWAKPVWGIWWTWDARLTTTLILFLIYVGYLLVRHYVAEESRRALLAAVVGIIGFVDVPIVYMANRWWRTQHPQPVIAGGESSGLDPRMLLGVLWVFAGLLTFAGLLLLQRYRLECVRAELTRLARRTARA